MVLKHKNMPQNFLDASEPKTKENKTNIKQTRKQNNNKTDRKPASNLYGSGLFLFLLKHNHSQTT